MLVNLTGCYCRTGIFGFGSEESHLEHTAGFTEQTSKTQKHGIVFTFQNETLDRVMRLETDSPLGFSSSAGH